MFKSNKFNNQSTFIKSALMCSAFILAACEPVEDTVGTQTQSDDLSQTQDNTQTLTQENTQTQTNVITQTESQTQTVTQTDEVTDSETQTQTEQMTDSATQTETQTQTQTQTQSETETETQIDPEPEGEEINGVYILDLQNDGNVAINIYDGDLETRWSAQSLNNEAAWIQFTLEDEEILAGIDIAFFNGDQRNTIFDIETSIDGEIWQSVYSGQSSGLTNSFEYFDIEEQEVTTIRIIGYGNSVNAWNSITEIEFYFDEDKEIEEQTQTQTETQTQTQTQTETETDTEIEIETGLINAEPIEYVNAMISNRETGVIETIEVNSVAQIHDAFINASPGDKIEIAAGTYTGSDDDSGSSRAYFYISESGTQDNPIWIVAKDLENQPVLQGTDNTTDYVLYITGDYIAVEGIKFKTGNQGIMLDNSNYSVLDNVEVYDIGQEAIHIRDGSSYTIVQNSFVHTTGLNVNKYGEGIYVGSDYKKWPENGGDYFKETDYVQIINNVIGPDVSAEHIDIKEGASYTTVSGNTFNGEGIDDTENGGTSYMDLKGNHGVVNYNLSLENDNELIEHAFEVNTKQEGWGHYNIIHNNEINFTDDNYTAYIVEWNNSSSFTSPQGTVEYDNIRIPEDATHMNNIP